MAKITDRSELNEAPNNADLVHIVDSSDTTDNPLGSSKYTTIANFFLTLTTAIGLNTVKRTYPVADETKVGHISVTQAVDLDVIESDTATNNAKNTYPSADAAKLASVEALADVTDTANVVAAGAEITTNKDSANGYPGLDATSKINPLQLPALAISKTFVIATEVAQLALTVQEGDVAVRTDENKSYIALNGTNATMADWQELLTPTDQVASVFGRQGIVTAQNGDYTTAQVTESTDKKYVTDAEKTLLSEIEDQSIIWALAY